MKHVQAIEYRNKTEPPTEDGWYYARDKSYADAGIEPVYVESGYVYITATQIVGLPDHLDDYDFFGPVRIVKEG